MAVWQSILEDATLRSGVIVSADGNLHAAASFARERIANGTQQPQRVESPAASDSHRPDLLLPLVRAWQSSTIATEREAGEHYLRTAGSLKHESGKGLLFSVRGCTILCQNGLSGKLCSQGTLQQIHR